MEEIRGNRTPELSPPSEDTSKEKKKSKKKARFPIGDIAKVESEKTEEKPKVETSAIEAALANLAAKKSAEADKKEKPKETPEPTIEESTETKSESTEEATAEQESDTEPESEQEDWAEAVEVEDEEMYEALPRQDLNAKEIGGGEFVLELRGDAPIEEREILLQDTRPIETETIPLHPDEEQAAHIEEEGESEAESEDDATTTHSQATTSSPSAAAPIAAANQGGANMPPTPPNLNAAAPVPHPNNPNSPFLFPAYNHNVVAAASAANVQTGPTQTDVEDAAYYAHKAGIRKGLGTGLLVGGAYEHFKHKRREKRAAKQFEQEAKKLEKQNENLQFNVGEQAKQNTKLKEQVHETERQLSDAQEQTPEQTSAPLRNAERLSQLTPETRVVAAANVAPGISGPSAEVPVKKPEVLPVAPEEDLLQIPEGHHLENSAWHAIEVDNKTGKAVENPTFQYGHEYYRERAQESTPVAQSSTAAGELAIAAVAGGGSSDGTDQKALPDSSHIPSASTQGTPPTRKERATQAAQGIKDSAQSAMSDAAIWPWAVALVVIIIILLMLL